MGQKEKPQSKELGSQHPGLAKAIRAYRRLRAIDRKYNLWPGHASLLVGMPGATDLVAHKDLVAAGIWWQKLYDACTEGGIELADVLRVVSAEDDRSSLDDGKTAYDP